MGTALAQAKQEWHRFKHDKPGERFENHRERMKHRSRAMTVAGVGLGVALLLGGVVLLFMPGPGLLLIVFGLALVASQSKPLAGVLDRIEPWVRRKVHKTQRHWKALPGAGKISVLLAIGLVGVAVMLATWKWVISAYLL
jgi:hypothetical protein